MTRKASAPARALSIVALFTAALTFLVPSAAAAPQTDAAHPSVPVQVSTKAQGAVRPPLLGAGNAQRVAPPGLRSEKAKTAPNSPPPSFFPAVTYSSGGPIAASLTVADLNGGSTPDLVVVNSNGSILPYSIGSVGVLLGNGNGTFQTAASYATLAWNPIPVAVADVNGDGIPDLVVVNSNNEYGSEEFDSLVAVLLGNGDGTFGNTYYEYQLYATPGATSVVVTDVNGDGKPDILVTLGASVAVLLGNGDGTFQQAVYYSSGSYQALQLVVSDVNGDGNLDLVVANGCDDPYACTSNTVGVLLGNGDGTFQPPVTYPSGGSTSVRLLFTDVNGDGKPDILLANYSSCTTCEGDGSISVLLAGGDGTFQPAVTYDSGGFGADSIAAADLNGNGKLDLLVANNNSTDTSHVCSAEGTIAVLMGNGDGTFQPAVLYGSGGYGLNSMTTSDLSGNGIPDVIVASPCASTTGSATVAGVLQGNGDGTFQPAVLYSSGGYSQSSASLAVVDANGDGQPDLLVVNYSGNDMGTGSVGVLLNNSLASSPTTTTLVSSLNPSVFGQTIAFTATVTATSGTPTGTVILYNGSTAVGSGTLAGGKASVLVSSLPAGSDPITAAHQDNGTFGYSTSVPLNQAVNPATTTTSVVGSPNPVPLNNSVAYTATVTGQYGGAATGRVTFEDGGTVIATVALSGNQAAYKTSYSTAGLHPITAIYSGDSNNVGSTSPVLTEAVENVLFPTETALVTSGSPSIIGQPVTFTATVTSIYGPIPNGELVTFYDGTVVIGTGTTAGGLSMFTTSSLTEKAHTIKAVYAGDAFFKTSSGTVTQVVTGYPTSTSLTSSLNPSIYGQSVTWTVTVTPSGSVLPTGKVTLTWAGNFLATITLSASGVATLTRSNLNADSYPMIATYLGDTNNAGSASAILNQLVEETTSSTKLTSSPNPSTAGQTVKFTATVTSPTVKARGPVTFAIGNTVLGTGELNWNNQATISISSLPVGSATVTATYYGDSNISESSASVTQTVQP